LTFTDFSGKLYPVSERKNNMKNEMNNEIVSPIDNGQVITSEERISRDEANEWTDTDWWMCNECE